MANKVLESLKIICEPGATYELRMLKTPKGTVSGYFDGEHLEEMARIAEACSGMVESVYMTLNPVKPDLLARAANRTIRFARHTTDDGEIAHRRWLPLDFDPVRPSGVSSTDEEHEMAIARARAVRTLIARDHGGSLGLLADSGNGAHLLYPVHLPNNAASLAIAKAFVKKIADQFSDDRVSVDQKVVNAGRVWKVYGTKACKGDEVLGRKHRMATILEGSSGPQIIS